MEGTVTLAGSVKLKEEDKRQPSGTEAAGVSKLGVPKPLISLKAQVRRRTVFLVVLLDISVVDDMIVHIFLEHVLWGRS